MTTLGTASQGGQTTSGFVDVDGAGSGSGDGGGVISVVADVGVGCFC